MASTQTFTPDWYSSPGETINEFIDNHNISLSDFAQKMRLSISEVNSLLQGQMRISLAIAQRMAELFGTTTKFWINREMQYREDLLRFKKLYSSEDEVNWLKEIPVRDLLKFGWIDKENFSVNKVAECLKFFSQPNVEAWRQSYNSLFSLAAYRTSYTFDSQIGAVASWLRQGEILAENIDCKKWNAAKFAKSLPQYKSLTTLKNPAEFIPKMVDIGRECGVAIVVLRAPNKCRVSGATRFISSDKALLLLSFRYLSDDHFWFSFFHEAGHLVLHGNRATYIESSEMGISQDEIEANEFAAKTIIPDELKNEFLTLKANDKEVIRFSRKANICPGIIVGQMQHLQLIRRNQLNHLKRRFKWK